MSCAMCVTCSNLWRASKPPKTPSFNTNLSENQNPLNGWWECSETSPECTKLYIQVHQVLIFLQEHSHYTFHSSAILITISISTAWRRLHPPPSYSVSNFSNYTAVKGTIFDVSLWFECITHYPADNEGKEATLGNFMAVCAVCVVSSYANIKVDSSGQKYVPWCDCS